MAEQVPFGNVLVELAANPEPRCPLVLVLDISGSMAGAPIAALNAGLRTLQMDLLTDSLAAQRVEIAIVTFGGQVELASDFQVAQSFQAPMLVSGGDTPMCAAILQAIEMVGQRKAAYKQAGIHYYRPWIFLITDGEPTDTEKWQSAVKQVHQGEKAKQFAFFAVAVQDANLENLRQLAVRDPIELEGLKFRELFLWLSQSQRSISHSKPGEENKVALPNPSGWARL